MRVHADPAEQRLHARECHADQLPRARLRRAFDDRGERRAEGPLGIARTAFVAGRREPRQRPDGSRLRQCGVFGDQVGEQRLQQIRAGGRQLARTSAHFAAGISREPIDGIVAIERVALETLARRRARPTERFDEHMAPIAPEIRCTLAWQPPFLVNGGPRGVLGSVLWYARITSRVPRRR